MFRLPGPVCIESRDWFEIDDGTLVRHFSPYPGVIGQVPAAEVEDVSAPKILVAEDVLKIAPAAGDRAATIASALNRATTDAGISTRIGADQSTEVRIGSPNGPLLLTGPTTQAIGHTAKADGTLEYTVGGTPVSISSGALAGKAQALSGLAAASSDDYAVALQE